MLRNLKKIVELTRSYGVEELKSVTLLFRVGMQVIWMKRWKHAELIKTSNTRDTMTERSANPYIYLLYMSPNWFRYSTMSVTLMNPLSDYVQSCCERNPTAKHKNLRNVHLPLTFQIKQELLKPYIVRRTPKTNTLDSKIIQYSGV